MKKEIERKFLITKEVFDIYTDNKPFQLIDDIYLFETVRLRRIAENGIARHILTRKSEGTLIRDEEEVEFSNSTLLYQIFRDLKYLSKERYKVAIEGKTYEFNKFLNLPFSLFIVEIELDYPNESIIKLGEEITENKEYYGYYLWSKIQSTGGL